jgi:hypothetical protein
MRIRNPIDRPRLLTKMDYHQWPNSLPLATQEQLCGGRIHPRNRWTIDGWPGIWARVIDSRTYRPGVKPFGSDRLARCIGVNGGVRVRAFSRIEEQEVS